MIALSFVIPSPEVAIAKENLQKFLNQEIVDQRPFALAGPNDLVQLVADSPGWSIVLRELVVLFGYEFVKSMVKDAGKQMWADRKLHLQRLRAVPGHLYAVAKAFMEAKADGSAVACAVPYGGPSGRNIGMEIESTDALEVVASIVKFAAIAPLVEDLVRELSAPIAGKGLTLCLRQAADQSGRILLTSDNHLVLGVQYCSGERGRVTGEIRLKLPETVEETVSRVASEIERERFLATQKA